MTDDLKIQFTPEAQADIDRLLAEKPQIKPAFDELKANMHQAMQAVHEGRYETFEDAMEAITGHRPVPIE